MPPGRSWLTEDLWNKIIDLEEAQPEIFGGLKVDLLRTPIYLALGENELRLNPSADDFDGYEFPTPPGKTTYTDVYKFWRLVSPALEQKFDLKVTFFGVKF